MTDQFTPAIGLGNCHVQTVFGRVHRPVPWIETQCRWYETPDGDCLALLTPRPLVDDPDLPLVLILHGLAGSVASPYVQGMMDSLLSHRYQVAVMHFRGCGGVPNRLPRAYHSGDSEDPRWMVEQLRGELPATPIMVVGYSLGGNVLLKMLGEDGSCSPVAAAVAISSPMDLHACSRKINTGLSKLYQRHLLSCLRLTLKKKAEDPCIAAALPNVEDATFFANFRCFDDTFTAPLHGFRDADDYYTRASSKHLLREIGVPTMIINSVDDPFVCPSAIPEKKEVSSMVQLEVTLQGGHVGFVSGSLWRPNYWLEHKVPKFLDSAILRDKG
ncbi:hydrolase [Microbulbifer sp. THAF38]|uniref:hydrolase n=1 Tax=Microbulbifer sp. THAF38 TaxID=2587856 RepID=UPI0012695F25|nr:hydrolase [Microbulbifer sp. THAF38]QFT54770.1 putative hydrolase [Microbulbifer sp. THAF38]